MTVGQDDVRDRPFPGGAADQRDAPSAWRLPQSTGNPPRHCSTGVVTGRVRWPQCRQSACAGSLYPAHSRHDQVVGGG